MGRLNQRGRGPPKNVPQLTVQAGARPFDRACGRVLKFGHEIPTPSISSYFGVGLRHGFRADSLERAWDSRWPHSPDQRADYLHGHPAQEAAALDFEHPVEQELRAALTGAEGGVPCPVRIAPRCGRATLPAPGPEA